MFLVSSCCCLCPIHWYQVLGWEWGCSWSSADRRCSNYFWVINNVIAYLGAAYIREFTVLIYLIRVWLHWIVSCFFTLFSCCTNTALFAQISSVYHKDPQQAQTNTPIRKSITNTPSTINQGHWLIIHYQVKPRGQSWNVIQKTFIKVTTQHIMGAMNQVSSSGDHIYKYIIENLWSRNPLAKRPEKCTKAGY